MILFLFVVYVVGIVVLGRWLKARDERIGWTAGGESEPTCCSCALPRPNEYGACGRCGLLVVTRGH